MLKKSWYNSERKWKRQENMFWFRDRWTDSANDFQVVKF